MTSSVIRRLLSIGLLILVSTAVTAWVSLAFADNDCDKNEDKNCSHSEKNQNSSPNINCEIHISAEDHLNNNDFGPNEQQCLNNSNNIQDSTVIQNPSDGGDFASPTVVSTDPSDGDNNVPTDLSEIKVTFDEKIDKDSIDSGSLSVFTNNCGNFICNDPDIQDVSVSSKTATFSINSNDRLSPDTNYIASISSSIQDQDGNFLNCFDSKGVDDNCEWDFSTSGTSLSPTITLNPSTGPFGSTVTITGTGFAPNINVAITFDGVLVPTNPATVTTNNNGEFSATITVPVSLSGVHTIAANLASKSFRVTSATVPTITLNPNSGPIDSQVTVTGKGYAPNSTINIIFDGIPVTTNPSTVNTNANGEFSTSFVLPSSSIGDHTVKAAQGSNTASATFEVTSNPISTTALPPSLSEEMIIPNLFG